VTRVLLVEDEESFSDALSYLLRKEGFQVAVCPAGPDALAMFDRGGADLVLPGLMLPGPAGDTPALVSSPGRAFRRSFPMRPGSSGFGR
jgi:DNA-binding response OmpR family regulator